MSIGLVVFLCIGLFAFIIFLSGMRIVRPTTRGLIERLGKYNRFANPGFHFVFPGIEKMIKINVTEQMTESGPREMITNDNLNATIDSQIYFKVKDNEDSVKKSQYNVNDVKVQIVSLTKTTLRNIIGTLSLKSANSERNKINGELYKTLTHETETWGIEIVRTELKQIEPPKDVQETMNKIVKAENEKLAAVDTATALETTADGKKRAAIKEAEGEKQATILRSEGTKEARIRQAEGEAEAIRLVNEAADKYFVGNAQILKKLEAVVDSFDENSKIIVPSNQSLTMVVSELAGINVVPVGK